MLDVASGDRPGRDKARDIWEADEGDEKERRGSRQDDSWRRLNGEDKAPCNGARVTDLRVRLNKQVWTIFVKFSMLSSVC